MPWCPDRLWGASWIRGLWGLVAMLASSVSQFVCETLPSGLELRPLMGPCSWCDMSGATWNTPGVDWSSCTSCSSGRSSAETETVMQIVFEIVFLHFQKKTWVANLITELHVTLVRRAARWRGQALVAFKQIEGLVHTWALCLDFLDSLRDRLSFHFPHHIITCQLSRLWMQEKR